MGKTLSEFYVTKKVIETKGAAEIFLKSEFVEFFKD